MNKIIEKILVTEKNIYKIIVITRICKFFKFVVNCFVDISIFGISKSPGLWRNFVRYSYLCFQPYQNAN